MGIRKHFGWLNADIGRSLALSALGTIMLGVGYSGWVGEWWAKENHDRVSWFILLSGLALAGFHFLGDRAERIGSERARKHFIAATIVLGILVVAMLVGCAALTSLMVGVVIGLFVLPT